TDRRKQIPYFPSAARLVGVDSPRHAEQPGNVHHIKCQVKADQEQPEMYFAETFVQHSPGDFWIPVIKCGEERKQNSAHDHVVKMRNNKVRAAKLPVERSNAQHYAGETGNQKLKQKSDAE